MVKNVFEDIFWTSNTQISSWFNKFKSHKIFNLPFILALCVRQSSYITQLMYSYLNSWILIGWINLKSVLFWVFRQIFSRIFKFEPYFDGFYNLTRIFPIFGTKTSPTWSYELTVSDSSMADSKLAPICSPLRPKWKQLCFIWRPSKKNISAENHFEKDGFGENGVG